MEWTKSDTLALAKGKCTTCQGIGIFTKENGEEDTCNCVYRRIFRTCFKRFADCATRNAQIGRVSPERAVTRETNGCWSRKDEEYMVDFCLVAKRTLSEEDHRIFRLHFLLSADYRLCCRKLKVDRGTFFHSVYRIQQRLGQAFAEVEPYPLFPLNEYFSGPMRRDTPKVVPMKPAKAMLSTMVPLKKVA